MSPKKYYFAEFSEHDVLFYLAQKAKHAMQDNDFINKIYQKYDQVLYGQFSGHIFNLMKLNTQSIVSNCLRNFCSNPIQDSISTSPEIKNQSTSTPVIKNRNLSTKRKTNLQFDNAGNEASKSVTSSPEKQPTPMKVVPSTKESDSLLQEHISADKKGPHIVTRNRRKQLNPMEKNQNAPEFENSLHKWLPLGRKEIDEAETVNFESHNVRHQTVITKAIMSPKENCKVISYSKTKTNEKFDNLNAQDIIKIGNLKVDKRQLEKSGEIFEKSATLTTNVTENADLFKEVRVSESTTGYEKNINSEKKATTSDNRKLIGSSEETTLITIQRESEKKHLCPVKISGNPLTITQDPPCSVDETEMLLYSTQGSKVDISPTQGNNLFKSSGKKKKYPSPRTNKVLFSFLPRFLQSPGVVETETVSYLVVDNLSPTTSPIPLAEYKIMNTGRDNIDQEKSTKDINFYVNESKAGSSRDTSPSGKSSLTSNTFKNYGKLKNYWKSTSLQEDTVLSSSAPRIIHPPGALEIDTDTSYLSEENFIPTTSSVSSVDYKIHEGRTNNIDKNNSPKENHFSERTESKVVSSRDISPLEKANLVSTPLGETNRNSPIIDGTRLGNDFYKLLKEIPPTNLSSKTVSSPGINDLELNALAYCMKELAAIVSMREQSMQLFYDSLLDFRKSLEYLITYIINIIHIVKNISIVNKDHVTEEDKQNFFAIMQLSANLLNKYNLWYSDLQLYIQFWDECLQQIHEIKSRNEPFLSNDQPPVTIVILQAYEEELKIKWKQLDDTIPFLVARISLFLATAEYLENFVNLLVKCLITIGILKPLTLML